MFIVSRVKSWFYRIFFGVERWFKERLFGCHSCGQCVVRTMPFVCPMQCPKQLRNGPCGGSVNGNCEVYPDRDCIWTRIHDKSEILGRTDKLETIQPAVDWSLYNSSAILNVVEKKTDNKGGVKSAHPEPHEKPAELRLDSNTKFSAVEPEEEVEETPQAACGCGCSCKMK